MGVLTRYLLREYWKIFGLCFLALAVVYLTIDFFGKIQRIIRFDASIAALASYFLLRIPKIVVDVTPIATLMAVLLTLGLLSRHNELIAMRAGGIGTLRLSSPFLVSGLAISLLLTLANLSLVPTSIQRSDNVRYLLIKKQPPDIYFRQSRLWLRAGPQSFMSVQMADSRTSTLFSVNLYKLQEDFSLAEHLEAKSVHYENGEWVLRDAIRRTFEPDGVVKVDHLDRSVLPLNRRPEDFTRIEKDTDKMTYRELSNYVATLDEDGYDARGYRVDLHGKIAMPFMSLVFGLIGMPLGLSRVFGRGLSRGIGLGLILAAAYWIIHSLSISFGHGHLLNPWAAAWLPNILFTLVGLFLIAGLKG